MSNLTDISYEQKVCVGGVVHVMNDMLTIPYNAVNEITAADFEYFLAILAKGNYLTTGANYVNPVIYESNITFFIPNSVSHSFAVSSSAKY